MESVPEGKTATLGVMSMANGERNNGVHCMPGIVGNVTYGYLLNGKVQWDPHDTKSESGSNLMDQHLIDDNG